MGEQRKFFSHTWPESDLILGPSAPRSSALTTMPQRLSNKMLDHKIPQWKQSVKSPCMDLFYHITSSRMSINSGIKAIALMVCTCGRHRQFRFNSQQCLGIKRLILLKKLGCFLGPKSFNHKNASYLVRGLQYYKSSGIHLHYHHLPSCTYEIRKLFSFRSLMDARSALCMVHRVLASA